MLHAVRRGATCLCLRFVRTSVLDKFKVPRFFIANLILGPGWKKPDNMNYFIEISNGKKGPLSFDQVKAYKLA